MEVTYNLEPKDLVQFNKFWWRRKSSLQAWLFMIGALALVFILGASAVVGMTRTHIRSSWSLMLWFFFMLILFPLLFLPLYRFLVGRTARAIPGFVGLHTMAIYPVGLIQKTAVAEIKVQWSSIADITEDEALIYVFPNQRSAFMIPKRDFAGPQEAQEYLEAAKHCWKNPGQISPPLPERTNTWPPPTQTLNS